MKNFKVVMAAALMLSGACAYAAESTKKVYFEFAKGQGAEKSADLEIVYADRSLKLGDVSRPEVANVLNKEIVEIYVHGGDELSDRQIKQINDEIRRASSGKLTIIITAQGNGAYSLSFKK